MAGITDRVYRLMLRRMGGVGLVTMEFISADAISRGNARQLRKMVFDEEERPLSIQVYGSSVERMVAAAEIVEELSPDVCDINMGCPANKVLKGCSGAALMGDLPLAKEMIRQVKRRLSIPLTVKFRLGLDTQRRTFLELGRICEGEGAAAVAMHGRTARQMYTGRADWSAISELKRELSIPVVGNGDVETPQDALAMFRQTRTATMDERRDLILWHFSEIEKDSESPTHAMHRLRTMTGWYTHGLPNGRALRVRISGLATPADFRAAVEEHFSRSAVAA
jgi:tRNA-dihydrouridine synthase B